MTVKASLSPERARAHRLRATVELVGTVAVTATQIVAAVGAIASILRRGTGCR